MGYRFTAGSRTGTTTCLATAQSHTHRGEITWDMTRPNTGYLNTPWDMSYSHKIMDMMERDLGVVFSAEERAGYVEVGRGLRQTRQALHLSVLPFRIYRESGGKPSVKGQIKNLCDVWDELDKAGVGDWGKLIVLHCIGFGLRGMAWSSRSDQQWWLKTVTYFSDSQVCFDVNRIISRIAYLFPPLIGVEVPAHNALTAVGNTSMNTARDIRLEQGTVCARAQDYLADKLETIMDGETMPQSISDIDLVAAVANEFEVVFQLIKARAVELSIQKSEASLAPFNSPLAAVKNRSDLVQLSAPAEEAVA